MKLVLFAVLSSMICAVVFGQRLSAEDRTQLRNIRGEISILIENIKGLHILIARIRRTELPAAQNRLRALRNNNTITEDQLQAARDEIGDIRTELNENIESRREERAIVQCLRGCIRTFHSNRNREILTICEGNCN